MSDRTGAPRRTADRESARETYRSRLAQYHRREAMSLWVGAGLGGLVVLTSGFMAFQQPPRLLVALTVTFLVFAGGALAFARVGFEWRATTIERLADGNEIRLDERLRDTHTRWPMWHETLWLASLCLIGLAAGSFLIGVWMTV